MSRRRSAPAAILPYIMQQVTRSFFSTEGRRSERCASRAGRGTLPGTDGRLRTPADGAAAPKQSPVVRLNRNMYFATGVVVAIGVYLLVLNPSMANNLWTMFASANQMLAALTLLTASLWLFKNKLKFSGTAVFQLFLQNLDKWMKQGFAAGGVTAIGSITLFCLAIVLLVLGALKLRALVKMRIIRAITKTA